MPTTGAVKSIFPGTRALLMGQDAVYGVPSGSGAPTPEALPGSTASVPQVIAPRTPTQNSLRTIIWRVFPSGATVDLAFQVSIDSVSGNFVTVDTFSGTGNS